MLQRKGWFIVFLLVVVSVCSSSCSSDISVSHASTIVFSYGEGGSLKDTIYAELESRFEHLNPDIDVFMHPIGGVTDVERTFYLTTLKAQSTFIDVFELDEVWTSEFAASDLLLPLNDGTTDFVLADFHPLVVNSAKYQNKLYALPYALTYGMYYVRKDLFLKHRLSYPKTITELSNVASLLREKENIGGLAVPTKKYEGLNCLFFELYYNLGGTLALQEGHLLFNEQVLIKTLSFLANNFSTNKFLYVPVFDADEVDNVESFSHGDVACMRNWQVAEAYIEHVPFEKIPVPGMGISLAGGFHVAINKHSHYPQQAKRFIAFLTSPAVQEYLWQTRKQGPAVLKVLKKTIKTDSLDALPVLQYRPRTPYYHFFRKKLVTILADILHQKVDIVTAVKEIMEASKQMTMAKTAGDGFLKQTKGFDWFY